MIDYNLLKHKVDIERLLELLGIEAELKGEEYFSVCPFDEHNDTAPSFSIQRSGQHQGVFYCFGCKSRGFITHLVQRVLGLSRLQAEDKLIEWFGLTRSIYSPSVAEIRRKLELTSDNKIQEEIVQIPLPRYDEDNIEPIVQYLMGRRRYTYQKALEIINTFGLKYCSSGYYKRRIIIPIYDYECNQIYFEAAAIDDSITPKKLYPKGSEMGKISFYNRYVEGYCWVVEGIWDAIRIHSFGEPVFGCFGSKLSSAQANMLIKHYENVIFLFDGDEAGRDGIHGKYHGTINHILGAKEILSPYINTFTVNLLYGDPDELSYQDFKEIKNWWLQGLLKEDIKINEILYRNDLISREYY